MDQVKPPSKRKMPGWLLPAFGFIVSVGCLIWVFSKFPYAELRTHLQTLGWWWIVVAVAAEVAAFLVDAWRWKVVLAPAGEPRYGACLQSVLVGLFANDVLPARTGELIRCFLLSKETEIHLPVVFTSAILMRVMDGIWITLLYFTIAFQLPNQSGISRAMSIYGVVVAILAAVLFFAIFQRHHTHRFLESRKWTAHVSHFLEEIHHLAHWRPLGMSFLYCGLGWLLHALAIWAITRSDDFFFDASQVTFLLVMKSVGTMIPSAPAGVGAFQATAVFALQRLLTEAPDAKILAQLLFTFLTLPGLVGGALAIAFAGYSLSELHHHAHKAHNHRRSG